MPVRLRRFDADADPPINLASVRIVAWRALQEVDISGFQVRVSEIAPIGLLDDQSNPKNCLRECSG